MTVLSFLLISSIQAQSLKLTGKVVNEKNQAISGVTIQVAGDGGAMSDVDGNFFCHSRLGKKI